MGDRDAGRAAIDRRGLRPLRFARSAWCGKRSFGPGGRAGARRRWSVSVASLRNDLEPAALSLLPSLGSVRDALLEAGRTRRRDERKRLGLVRPCARRGARGGDRRARPLTDRSRLGDPLARPRRPDRRALKTPSTRGLSGRGTARCRSSMLDGVLQSRHDFEQVATSEGIVRSLGSGVNVASISDFDSEGSGSTPEGPATLQSTLFDPILGEWQRAV